MTIAQSPKILALTIAMALPLASCVSFGSAEPPEALLTLTPDEPLARDSARDATTSKALIVSLPQSPRSLNTNRVPVQVDDTSIAYVQQALWVDRPAKLFQALVMETVRARTERLVLPIEDAQSREATIISGTLVHFGYDARSGEAVVTYDAVRRERSGEVSTRRFEEREPVSLVEAAPVGRAINNAANRVAIAIADWVGE
ncbi:MAG: ABC-type transport auxiliary lipoprotein family protein [Pseudomonadota bacterium]